jgi:2-polyprenyl-3-methyl-5-hydroxy-6-metoxy-1,4-benzoquinol methylase
MKPNIVKTRAEEYWELKGGSKWKSKLEKRASQLHYVNQLRLVDAVFGRDDFKGKSVLEIGCGYGRILKYLEHCHGIVADGLDQSTSMLECATENGINSKRLTRMNMREAPKNMKRYDILFTCEMLIHVHPYHLFQVVDTIVKKANFAVVNIETSPNNKFYTDECNAGFWKHDYLILYKLLGEKVKVISQEGTKHSAYIVLK